jgi:hypothetical protein
MNRIGFSLSGNWWLRAGLARGLLQQPRFGWQVKTAFVFSFETALCLALFQRFGGGAKSWVSAPSRFIE